MPVALDEHNTTTLSPVIEIPYPEGLWYQIDDLMKDDSKPWLKMFGENVCEAVYPPDSPITRVETKVNGIKKAFDWAEVEGKPGHYKAVSEPVPGFNIETHYDFIEGLDVDMKRLYGDLEAKNYAVSGYTLDPAGRIIFIVKTSRNTEFECRYVPKEISKTPVMIVSVLDNYPHKSAPVGRVFESPEQVQDAISDAAELNEAVLQNLTSALDMNNDGRSVSLRWEAKKFQNPIWKPHVENIEKILSLPIDQLNRDIVRLVDTAYAEKYVEDTVLPAGLDSDAHQLLDLLITYFHGKSQQEIYDIHGLDEKDQSLLAIALLLESLNRGTNLKDSFYPYSQPECAGRELAIYGESNRNRLGFFKQQNRKYGYRPELGEPAKFLLLHTKQVGDQYTEYERIQSQNLIDARLWLNSQRFSFSNSEQATNIVQALNQRLLNGLVPDRDAGRFRRTEGAYIEGRAEFSYVSAIPFDVAHLLSRVETFILHETQGKTKNEILEKLVTSWVAFDQIHPMEEGNGRTGTLLFEYWCKQAFGPDAQFISPRNETGVLSRAMTDALSKKDSNDRSNGVPGNIEPLIKYVVAHLSGVEDLQS